MTHDEFQTKVMRLARRECSPDEAGMIALELIHEYRRARREYGRSRRCKAPPTRSGELASAIERITDSAGPTCEHCGNMATLHVFAGRESWQCDECGTGVPDREAER